MRRAIEDMAQQQADARGLRRDEREDDEWSAARAKDLAVGIDSVAFLLRCACLAGDFEGEDDEGDGFGVSIFLWLGF